MLVWFSIDSPMRAQVISISDSRSGKAREDVIVSSDLPAWTIRTNALGQAEISRLAGSARIEFSTPGYESLEFSYEALRGMGFTVKLSPEVLTLDNVAISVSRWNQLSRKTPEKVVAISRKNTLLQNPQTAADLLGISGKVFIQKSQQGGGSPMIRGFSTNRLLYAVDGVRMNTAIFRSGNLQNVISLDPFAMERTEVLFGPGSVMYGSDAIGGVMSFTTLMPEMAAGTKPLVTGKALMRYSSANQENTAHFDVSVGGRKWGMLTSFSTFDFGDLRMGSYGPEPYLRPFYTQRQGNQDVVIANPDPRVQRPSGYSQINLMQKVRFRPTDAWDFQYGFHHSATSSYSRYDRLIRYRNGLPRSGDWMYGPQLWTMHNLSAEHSGKSLLWDQFAVRLAYQEFEESRIDRDFNKTEERTRHEKVGAWSANLDLKKTLSARHVFLYGAEWVQNDVQSRGTDRDLGTGLRRPGPARYPQAQWSSAGVYATSQLELSSKFRLRTGLRYSHYALQASFDTSFYPFPFTDASFNRGAFTGSAGLVYSPRRKTLITFNASTGFRSPNVDDMGKVFDSRPGSVVIPNPNLEAEYAWNAEVGFARVFGDVLKLDIALYSTRLDNALVTRPYSLNGQDSLMYDGVLSRVEAMQNAARARVVGVQAGLELKLGGGFLFTSDYNFQQGTEELDNGNTSPSRHAPPAFGVTRLQYSDDRLTLQWYAQYSADRQFEALPFEEQGKPELYAIGADGRIYSPAWYTLNVKAMYQLDERFTLSAGLENLTDVRYRPYSSGIAAPGRNFVISLRASL